MRGLLKKNKKGVMWDILIPLILGLLVVAIIFFWIFQEYFTEETTNAEICKQSVIVRNTLPEYDIGIWNDKETSSIATVSFKNSYPLKCKTKVITIDYNDTEKATKEIMNQMAECWYIMGRGEYNIFPSRAFFGDSYCVECARIEFREDVKTYYTEHPINMEEGLDLEIEPQYSYKSYLTSKNHNSIIASDNYADEFKIFFGAGEEYKAETSNEKETSDIPFSLGYKYETFKDYDPCEKINDCEDGYTCRFLGTGQMIIDAFKFGRCIQDNRIEILCKNEPSGFQLEYILPLFAPSYGYNFTILDNSGQKISKIFHPNTDIILSDNSPEIECNGELIQDMRFEVKDEEPVIKEQIRNIIPNFLSSISELFQGKKTIIITLPEKINMTKGDLLITINTMLVTDKNFDTQLIFYQWNNGKVLEDLNKIYNAYTFQKDKNKIEVKNIAFCNNWDGIPG